MTTRPRPLLFVAVACSGLAGVACRTPTQITVEVTTSFHCDSLDGTSITVGRLGPALEEKPPVTSIRKTCDPVTGRIGALVVVPSGDDSDEVGLRVVVGLGSKTAEQCVSSGYLGGCIVARRALRFVPHTELTVPITMSLDCRDVPCGITETCVNGACRSATIADSTRCTGSGCDESVLVPSTATDAGVDAIADTTIDATTDVGDTGVGGCTGVECTGGIHVIAGESHSCAIAIGGAVKCWGLDDAGQVGVPGGGPPVLTPRTVTGLAPVTQLGAGKVHTCALLASRGVACWGGDGNLQLGTTSTPGVPAVVPGVVAARAIAVGTEDTFTLFDSSVTAWGGNVFGQLGTLPATDSDPVSVTALVDAVAIGAGDLHACALFKSGAVKCWGNNRYGDLGSGTIGEPPPTAPRAVTGLPAATTITAVGPNCALTIDGHVYCWGANDLGQLGDGSPPTGRADAGVVPGVDSVVQLGVRARSDHACVLLSSGKVTCWGSNNHGQLGRDTVSTSEPPAIVPGLDGVRALAVGDQHTCAWKGEGVIHCWGLNDDGQLGDGTQIDRHVPTPVKW